MRTKLLGLAVAVVALGVMVNALALSRATVGGNTVTIPITTTGGALIAILDGSDADFTVTSTGTKATATLPTGLQAASTYAFDGAFMITNHSANAVNITIPSSIDPVGDLTAIHVYQSGVADVAVTNVPVAAGASIEVKLVVTVSDTATVGANEFTFSIEAVRP